MTDVVGTGDRSAILFNAQHAKRVGWYGEIPERAQEEYPGLMHDPTVSNWADRQNFQLSVREFQHDHGVPVVDGKLGPDTWRKMVATYAPVSGPHVLYRGLRRELPADVWGAAHGPRMLTWEQPGGLDLHRKGGWSRSKTRELRSIVIHWGGTSARHCRDVLAARTLSSHFGVEGAVVYQWLDLELVAWHAGTSNTHAIGIDICQYPLAGDQGAPTKYLDAYREKGLDVSRTKDPTGRMGTRAAFLTLDPTTAATARRLVLDLAEIFAIEKITVRKPAGEVDHTSSDARRAASPGGVYGHHHLAAQKGDIGMWWDSLFHGTELG